MIGAIKAGEYELVACKQVDDNTGRLEYEPLAWPYGGEGCLHMLIQAFECVVTEEDVL